MREAELEIVEEYVMKRQNTAAQYIVKRQIMDLCEEAVRRLGAQVSKRWCKYEGLELEGGQAMIDAEDEEDPEGTDG